MSVNQLTLCSTYMPASASRSRLEQSGRPAAALSPASYSQPLLALHGMATLPSAACCAAACAVADCSCVEDVGRRVWYCLQHQVACEQAVSAGSNYVSTAATQTVQQGAQCPSGVLQTATVAGGLAGAPAAQMVGADDSRAAGLHDLLCAWVLVSPKVCALAAELEDMPVVNGCQHSKRT